MADLTGLELSGDLALLGTVLTVWAHPDDETYLAGGLLAALGEAGQRVVCVTATRGEAADPDATPGERAALARTRTRELEEALAVLGVAEHHWLDHADGGLSDLDPGIAAARLARLLDDVRPDTVVTFGPDGFTGHPDHRAVSGWVDLALRRSTAAPRLLHAVAREEVADPGLDQDFGVFELGRPRVCADADLALLLRLDGASLDRKVEALLRQVSQTAGLVDAVGLARFRTWVAAEAFAPPRQRT
ncbi:PIG-L family deacetylase [Nocardioides guangzhouensis]|uniref:PIG-L family deacetylase n=1 Tax=Nocardioides guangzhouensis TaxID=2497878 RepID=A0A4V1XZ32_9ACTN|nr:PIG-L family deacetylase [Nocardioides guangzhouensis]RYP85339.1 PIG-L family deacetylase [Nocardioides guangzhouensis]